MKQNKKLNLSEAANQVMGVLDATGKSDADASGRGSMLPGPITGMPPATTPTNGMPSVPAAAMISQKYLASIGQGGAAPVARDSDEAEGSEEEMESED